MSYLEIKTDRGQNVFRSGMPLDEPNPPFMTRELHQPLGQVRVQTTIRNVPNLYSRVVRGGSNHIVVERVPFHVQHGTRVARDFERCVVVQSPILFMKEVKR